MAWKWLDGIVDSIGKGITGLVNWIGTGLTGVFSPQNINSLSGRVNAIDKINADFELEKLRERFQAEVESFRSGCNRQNALDSIAANFKLESSRQLANRKNMIDGIHADFALEEAREQFQCEMERRRQEFEVKKLKAQFLNQYNLQKDSHNFQAELAQKNFERSIQLANLNHENAVELQKFREEWENLRLTKRLKFETCLFEERKKHEWEIKQYDRETQIVLASISLNNTRQSAEYARILDVHPLITQTTPTLDFYKQYRDGSNPVPPLVVISPPALEFDQFPHVAKGFVAMEGKLTDKIRDFLSDNYPLHDSLRPTKFLGNAYKSKRVSGEAAIEILYWTHKSVPTVLIESKVDSDDIRLYLATWDMMESIYHYEKIFELSWKDVLYPLARENAKSWKEERDKLLQEGKTQEEIVQEGGDDEYNLKISELEEKDRKRGVEKQRNYKVNGAEYTQEFTQFLGFCHNILIGLSVDSYYLLNYRVCPKLPEVLSNLLKDVPIENLKKSLVESVVGNYRLLYQRLENELPDWIPELALDLAQSLAGLDDKSYSVQQITYSLYTFLKSRNCLEINYISDYSLMESILLAGDQAYFEKLELCLKSLGEQNTVAEAEELLQVWFRLQIEGKIKHKKTGDTLF